MAKQCPVRAQWDIIRPCEPLPASPVLARRFARGQQFEEEVAARLLALHPAAHVIPGRATGPGARMPRSCDEGRAPAHPGRAPARRSRWPAGGRARPAGGRDGRPGVPARGHQAPPVPRRRPGGWPSRCSPLDSPVPEAAELVPGSSARAHKEDLLQLAHYQRMLEACGMAAPGKRLGGIIGVDGVVTWYDLDARRWPTPSARAGRSGAPPWRCTTSSSPSASTSSRSPPSTGPTRRSRCSWCRCGSASARNAPGGPGAARGSGPDPATRACCRGLAGGNGVSIAATASPAGRRSPRSTTAPPPWSRPGGPAADHVGAGRPAR